MRRRQPGLAPLLVLLAGAPTAHALDVLPAQMELGDTEARILVRSATGRVSVETTPPVLAAGAAPEGTPGAFEPTPRELDADTSWRGLANVLVVVLRRPDPGTPVEVVLADGSQAGILVGWDAARRGVPGPASWLALCLAAVAARPRR